MLTKEQNERMTRVSHGTPMGTLFRRYWIPALLSDEIAEPDGPPVRVRLLGEDLVAFRDTSGNASLVGAYCPHRGAPLFFGRNEEDGIRCVYHGWKFDRSGICVHMPTERPDSNARSRIKLDAYPTWEGGGMIWTYMGPPELQPAPPAHELVRTPPGCRLVSKNYQACNFLQALEGAVDPTHASILHNMNIKDRSFLNDYDRLVAAINIERTKYGMTYTGVRSLGDNNWVRGYHWIMPSFHMRASVEGQFRPDTGHANDVATIDGHIWVPIDDGQTFVYNFMYSHDPSKALPAEQAHAAENVLGRGDHLVAGNFLKQTSANDYLIDRQKQKTQTFTGIDGINTQDVAVQEGMGAIVDRSKEHLGSSDRAIITMRRVFAAALDAIEKGEPIPAIDPDTYRNVRAIDRLVPKDLPWSEATREDYVARY